jgi:hypothetical protein
MREQGGVTQRDTGRGTLPNDLHGARWIVRRQQLAPAVERIIRRIGGTGQAETVQIVQ